MSESVTDGLPAQIAALAVGESVCRAERLDLDREVTREALLETRRRLRNSATKALGRARARAPRADWTMEVGHFHTSSLDVCVCLVVTRTR